MSAQSKDTAFLVIGGVVFLAATAWALLFKTSQPSFTAPTSGRAYEATNLTIQPPVSRQWAEPKSQSAGDKWLFDVFTPPKIYYNEETKQFTVIPPVRTVIEGPVVVDPPKPEFGLKLAKVEQPLFRLQLVGAVNFGPDARGTFSNSITGDIIIATKGRKIPELNLEITQFTAERRRTSVVGGSDIIIETITATVKDTETGVETRLDARTRLPEGGLKATLIASDGTERVVRAGETLTEGETTFQIVDLTLDPQAVTVKKITAEQPEGVTEVLTLAPPAVESPAPAESAAPAAADGFFPGF